jgi:hypothetical protein
MLTILVEVCRYFGGTHCLHLQGRHVSQAIRTNARLQDSRTPSADLCIVLASRSSWALQQPVMESALPSLCGEEGSGVCFKYDEEHRPTDQR